MNSSKSCWGGRLASEPSSESVGLSWIRAVGEKDSSDEDSESPDAMPSETYFFLVPLVGPGE